MKRFLMSVMVALFFTESFAQLSGDGFYRIQNAGSTRYAFVRDNKGSVSIGSTSADLGAIELWRNFDRAVSDPSTVVYFHKVEDKTYRFEAQGTNSYDIVGYDLKIRKNRDGVTYRAYQTKSGNTSYLCDAERADVDKGAMGTNDTGTNYRDWYIRPVEANSDYYFGVKPDLTVGADHYAAFYAGFPFTLASAGMKAYYVKKVERGMAVIEEIAGGAVPEATPVILKCASDQPANNKLDVVENSASALSDNLLQGVYFCNLHGTASNKGNHWNATEYDAKTMRLLTVSAEGKLVFETAAVDYLPANKAYLKVAAGTPDQLLVVTQKEFDDIIASGIEDVVGVDGQDAKIYSLSGMVVGEGRDVLKNLPAGVYVVAGKKYVVK